MILLLLIQFALAQDPSVGEVLEGEIKTQRGELKAGDDLLQGDRLESSGAQILLFPANQINVEGVLSLENVTDSDTSLKLESGKARVNVDSTENPQEFRVKTPYATFGVRGTEFEVEESSEGSALQVYDGQVEAQDQQGLKQRVVKGEAFQHRRGQGWARKEFKERKQQFRFLRRAQIQQKRELRRQMKMMRKDQRRLTRPMGKKPRR
ncbi:MAG: FecR family protein [Bacteriovoracaceae bacterium]|nr:FecR family protein [Bacteriovoracaceae bacterium]